MATHPLDVKDLSKILDALLINFGTISDKQGMIVAGQEANKNLKPVIFDPVAVGATSYRRDTAKGGCPPVRDRVSPSSLTMELYG
jgi:thiamine-phosphate diphosphorylase/hydroxyethylthiazole kinase